MKKFKWEIGMYAVRKGDKSVFPMLYQLKAFNGFKYPVMQGFIDGSVPMTLQEDWNKFVPFFIQKNDEFIEDDGLEIRKAVVKKLYYSAVEGETVGRVKFYDYQTDEFIEVREIPLISLMNDKIFILLNFEN